MRIRKICFFLGILLLLSSCGRVDGITFHGVNGVKMRGLKDSKLYLSMTLDIENPSNRKIVITKFEFIAWLNNRELGQMKNSDKIVLEKRTRSQLEVPVEISLRTAADAFKLIGSADKLLDQLTVEGFIKGKSFPASKKMRIPKQPFSQLMNSYGVTRTDTLKSSNPNEVIE